MLRVALDDFVASDVAQIVLQNVFGKQIDQCLNIHCHVFLILSFLKLPKVKILEG